MAAGGRSAKAIGVIDASEPGSGGDGGDGVPPSSGGRRHQVGDGGRAGLPPGLGGHHGLGTETVEVVAFLDALGLGRYLDPFLANGFDCMDVVRAMDENHMRDVGMVPGHILKLRKKLAEGSGGTSGASSGSHGGDVGGSGGGADSGYGGTPVYGPAGRGPPRSVTRAGPGVDNAQESTDKDSSRAAPGRVAALAPRMGPPPPRMAPPLGTVRTRTRTVRWAPPRMQPPPRARPRRP